MITLNPNPYNLNHINTLVRKNHRNKKPVSFGTCLYHETVSSSFSNALYGTVNNATHFFRVQINNFYADSIIKTFPEGVKIFNYACSDGSEPYSLVMLLINKLGLEEAKKKYFPITAKDIAPGIIKQAQKGIIGLNEKDENEIKNLFSLRNINKFFVPAKPDEQPICEDFNQFLVPEVLRENVIFSKADICQDAKNPEVFTGNKPGPSLLLFRNAMYHLTKEQQQKLYVDLYNNKSFEAGSICDFYNVGEPIDNSLTELKMFAPCNIPFQKVGAKFFFIKNKKGN